MPVSPNKSNPKMGRRFRLVKFFSKKVFTGGLIAIFGATLAFNTWQINALENQVAPCSQGPSRGFVGGLPPVDKGVSHSTSKHSSAVHDLIEHLREHLPLEEETEKFLIAAENYNRPGVNLDDECFKLQNLLTALEKKLTKTPSKENKEKVDVAKIIYEDLCQADIGQPTRTE